MGKPTNHMYVELQLLTRRKADIVARLLETERPKMKRKLVEVEKEETGKMIKSRSYGGI